MALYGVLGDVHGNLEALTAVLLALDAHGARKLLCTGDAVGYNADADACIGLLSAREAIAVAGNHDLITLRRLGFERCSNKARFALQRTRRELGEPGRQWLQAQPAVRLVEGAIALIHGGVRDPELYLRTAALVEENARLLREDVPEARICFFGHTHAQKLYLVGRSAGEMPSCRGPIALRRDALWFVNPGSVDAQRRREPRFAECALFDSGRWEVELLRVPYDSAATEAKAQAHGYRIGRIAEMAYTLGRRARRLIDTGVLRARHAPGGKTGGRDPGPGGRA